MIYSVLVILKNSAHNIEQLAAIKKIPVFNKQKN